MQELPGSGWLAAEPEATLQIPLVRVWGFPAVSPSHPNTFSDLTYDGRDRGTPSAEAGKLRAGVANHPDRDACQVIGIEGATGPFSVAKTKNRPRSREAPQATSATRRGACAQGRIGNGGSWGLGSWAG